MRGCCVVISNPLYHASEQFSVAPGSASASQKNQNFYPLSQNIGKGKGKAKADVIDLTLELEETANDRLWIDIYEPTTEAELAVHIRKVEDVRRWFIEAFNGGPSGKLKKYRRILVLTGPAGIAKTATVRVLSRELGFEILEWRNSVGDAFAVYDSEIMDYANNDSYEALMTKFETFFNRASNCQSVLTSPDHHTASIPQPSQPSSSLCEGPRDTTGRRVILLEDLPNVLHSCTQTRFHTILRASAQSPPSESPVPIVIIISDAQTVGEANDERVAQGRYRNGDGEGVVDIRTVLPRDLLGGPYVTQIRFNPIAPTLLRKALQNLLSTHFAQNKSAQPSKDVLDIVVETSNGDIRSAIMALQFACASPPIGKTRKKRDAKLTTLMLESITRREQSLVLFHLLGKVLYNKRKGDPSNSSMSAKNVQKENMLDSLIRDPPKLPVWLKEHDRRASRVDVDLLYASTPIDSGLFSLYIHQNYTEFATEVEECDGVADWLSWVDSSGGEAWYQANPHQFHLLTLGTLHSLPSPVPRRNQKILKPQFFEYLEKEKEAWGGVHDVQNWLMHRDENAWGTYGWTVSEIVLELGGVLKAINLDHLPKSHRNFSQMMFQMESTASQYQQLNEDEVNFSEKDDDARVVGNKGGSTDMANGGWLEDDDIEDF